MHAAADTLQRGITTDADMAIQRRRKLGIESPVDQTQIVEQSLALDLLQRLVKSQLTSLVCDLDVLFGGSGAK